MVKKRRAPFTRQMPLSKRQKRDVTRLIHRNQELKYVAGSQNAAAVSSTATVVGNPFDVSQGDTDSQRDGDQLMWCGHIDFRVSVTNSQGATGDIYNNVRIIIFQWHPNSTPSAANILLNGATGAPDCYSLYNHDLRQQFKILFDKVFVTAGNGNAATTPNTNIVNTGVKVYKIPLTKATKKVQYSGGGLTGTNRLYIFQVSDSVLVTHPTVSWSLKTVFRDS